MKKAVNRFVQIVKEESERQVLMYESAFFKAKDLVYLSREETELIKKHMVSRLSTGMDSKLIRAMEGIGKHLAVTDVGVPCDSVCRTLVRESKDHGKMVTEFMVQKYWETNEDVRGTFDKRFKEWEDHFWSKNEGDKAQTIAVIRSSLEVPF
jgi:hypothetical protein